MNLCWVEVDSTGVPCRIFANVKAAYRAAVLLAEGALKQWDYAAAVGIIRLRVFTRDNFSCTHCGEPVTWDGENKGEMHERTYRGNGGEISIDNSTVLCQRCHRHDKVAGHGKRQVLFSKSVI